LALLEQIKRFVWRLFSARLIQHVSNSVCATCYTPTHTHTHTCTHTHTHIHTHTHTATNIAQTVPLFTRALTLLAQMTHFIQCVLSQRLTDHMLNSVSATFYTPRRTAQMTRFIQCVFSKCLIQHVLNSVSAASLAHRRPPDYPTTHAPLCCSST